jgi:hypothetical protein
MITRGLNAVCNFFIPEALFLDLGRPPGIKMFGGTFTSDSYPFKDDLVALNLASQHSDIILMLGFELLPVDDEDEQTSIKNGYYAIANLVKSYANIQYVLVNHKDDLSVMFDKIANLSNDTAENVIKLLKTPDKG